MSHASSLTVVGTRRAPESKTLPPPKGSLTYYARHPDDYFKPHMYYASVLLVAIPAMHEKLQDLSKQLMKRVQTHLTLRCAKRTQLLDVLACAQISLGALCTEIYTWYGALSNANVEYLRKGCDIYLKQVKSRLSEPQQARPSTTSFTVTLAYRQAATGNVQASRDQVTTLLEEAQLLVEGYTRVADLVKHALDHISEPIFSWRRSTGALKDIFDQNLLEAVVAEFEPEERGQEWSSYKYRARAVLTDFTNQNSLESKKGVSQKQEELVRWIQWLKKSLASLQAVPK